MASKPHVYIKPNTIEYGEFKINKNGKREFKPHLHSKTGERYTHIKLPTVKNRTKAHGDQAYTFGKDSNGIDLDSREAYIQVPADCITAAYNKDLDMKQWYFNNPDARWNVYFKAERDPKTRTWDKPDVKKIGIQELMRLFPDSQEKAFKISPKRKKRDIQKKLEKDAVDKSIKKAKSTPDLGRDR